MAEPDVTVTIQDQTQPITKAGFNLPLILGGIDEGATRTTGTYGEYTSLSAVSDDFSEDTREYAAAERMFGQEPAPQKIAIYAVSRDTPASGDLETALNDLVKTQNDWYFIICTSHNDAVDGDTTEVADWAAANDKMFIASNNDADAVADITTLASGIASSRTGIYAHDDPDNEWLDAGIVATMATYAAGEATWKFKTVDGCTVADYDTTEIGNLHDGNVNTYVSKLGVNQTSDGKATDGSYLDIQRSKDWLVARIQEAIQMRLNNMAKIPLTDPGIAMVEGDIRNVMERATQQGIIATNLAGEGLYEVTAPTRAEISDVDLSNRILPDMYFELTVAGAVHTVDVTGVIQV